MRSSGRWYALPYGQASARATVDTTHELTLGSAQRLGQAPPRAANEQDTVIIPFGLIRPKPVEGRLPHRTQHGIHPHS
jgi:hypothetical protein